MPSSRIPAYTYTAPAFAAIVALGCLFLFTFVLPLPSPAFPSHGRKKSPEPAKPLGYINGVKEGSPGGVELQVHVSDRVWERNDTAEWLGGLLFEDIAQSGDGGVYAELIRNRAFQGSGIHVGNVPNIPYSSIVSSENPTLPFGPVLDGWSEIGDVRIHLDLLHPLSDALQVALQVDVPLDATGRVGIQNDGWWGMKVSPQVYDASFYAQADGARFNWTLTEFEVSLRSALENKTWCSEKIPIEHRLQPYEYIRFATALRCDAHAPNINNTFAITFDAKEAAGQTIYFDLISLFPETYKGRKNGLRKDIGEQLEALRPKFLRFPGGNNLEGYSIQRRWKWWKTIGDLKDRPGRPGDWTYYNTDGLGLLEYLEWCEDMRMEPLIALYAGFSLNIHNYDHGNSTGANEWPMRLMPQILREALDELEYCMGSVETYWGRQRALHGHPEPFVINMIEIGNEDFFSHHYPARAKFMYDGLKEHYPDITYIFSALNETSEFKTKIPPGGIWDAHVYAPASYFIQNFDYWDHFQDSPNQQQVQGSLMEYHASAVGAEGGVVNRHPRMGAAVAEAVYAIAGERNPNVFKLSCFAPLIQNLNAYRGTPYDILFTSDPDETVLSASYFQQQLFNSFPGTHTLPVSIYKGGINPLFWVASIDELRNIVYLKVVNAGNATQPLRVSLDMSVASVNGTILEPPLPGDLYAYNRAFDHIVVPKSIEGIEDAITHVDGLANFGWTVPSFSISVFQFSILAFGDEDGPGPLPLRSKSSTVLASNGQAKMEEYNKEDGDVLFDEEL